MPQVFIMEETGVRESGESAVLDIGPSLQDSLLLTFGITHAVEQESIELEIYGSASRDTCSVQPILTVPPKYYCGTYQIALNCSRLKYLKVAWRVSRWSRSREKPFFRFYLLAGPEVERLAMAGAA